jgi:hypothetical protein
MDRRHRTDAYSPLTSTMSKPLPRTRLHLVGSSSCTARPAAGVVGPSVNHLCKAGLQSPAAQNAHFVGTAPLDLHGTFTVNLRDAVPRCAESSTAVFRNDGVENVAALALVEQHHGYSPISLSIRLLVPLVVRRTIRLPQDVGPPRAAWTLPLCERPGTAGFGVTYGGPLVVLQDRRSSLAQPRSLRQAKSGQPA